MGTKHPDFFAALAAPFEPHEVKVRSQAGRQFQYVSARTIQNRLDSVCGPEGWTAHYEPFGDHGVRCRLTVTLPDGSTVTKENVGGYAGMADQGDDEKGAVSDALKRAAVEIGLSRYLYRDGVPSFVSERFHGSDAAAVAPRDAAAAVTTRYEEEERAAIRDEGRRYDGPRPEHHAAAVNGGGQHSRTNGGQQDRAPQNGKQLFGWVRRQEELYQTDLLRYLTGWAKIQDYPGRMIDWSTDQVSAAYAEGLRKVAALGGEVRGGAA